MAGEGLTQRRKGGGEGGTARRADGIGSNALGRSAVLPVTDPFPFQEEQTMRLAWTVLAGAAALSAAPAMAEGEGPALKTPTLVTAGSAPISVDIGHAAPFLADID